MAANPDPPGWRIRPVTRAEAATWGAVRAEMLKAHPTAFSSAYEDFIQLSQDEVAARVPEPGGADALFGVYLDGVLSGSAASRASAA